MRTRNNQCSDESDVGNVNFTNTMPPNNTSHFAAQITPFKGDSDLIEFFFTQILTLKKINNWSDEQTAFFLKNKLEGPALTFLVQSKELQTSNDVLFIKEKFENFFTQPSKLTFANQWQNLNLIPGESIKNFAHRLDTLTDKVYPNILDTNAINAIKFQKFFTALPSELKAKIHEHSIDNYDVAVKTAQHMQEVQQLPSGSSFNINTENDSFTKLINKIDNLQKEITILKENKESRGTSDQSYCPQQAQTHDTSRQPIFLPPRTRSQAYRSAKICEFCGKHGHVIARCFQRRNSQRTTPPLSPSVRFRSANRQQQRRGNFNGARSFVRKYPNE